MWKADRTYKRIIGYLKGLLSDRERHDLEKETMRDAFDEEAFEGLNQLSAAELEADMDVLVQRLNHRIYRNKKRTLSPLFLIAASFILIVGLGSVLYVVFKAPEDSMITQQTDNLTPPPPSKGSPVENLEMPDNEALKKKTDPKTVSVPAIVENQSESYALEEEESIVLNDEMIMSDEVIDEKSSTDLFEEKNPAGLLQKEMKPSEPEKDMNITAAPSTRSKKSENIRTRGLAKAETSSAVRVTDGQGQPLPGVNVVIKGTSQGTVTDINGRFELPTADSSLLSFSYIGFAPLEVKADQISGDIVMNEDMVALNEVVVVGYGTRKRNDETGAVSKVNMDEPGAHFSRPVPPGGSFKEFRKWVEDQIDYSLFKSYPGKYRIQVNLKILTDGSISELTVRNNIPDVIKEEYRRIIAESKRWTPAMENDMPVEAEITLKFALTVE